jgi:hypothetical protein
MQAIYRGETEGIAGINVTMFKGKYYNLASLD